MKRSEYFEFQKATFDRLIEVTKRKNADYAGVDDNPFSNFIRCEQLGICSTEQGFLTRMTDKLARVASFVKNGELQVKDESVMDTLGDLANYSVLMMGYLKSKESNG